MGKIRSVCQGFLDFTSYYLSSKTTVRIILLAAIIIRAIQIVYFFNTRNDMTFQILAAQNLYDGDGLTISKVSESDLGKIMCRPLIEWPPGFSLIFIPFYFVCGEDYLLAAISLSIVFSSILIYSTYTLLRALNAPDFYISLWLIFTSFHLYYFYLKPCTDAVAISCLMLSTSLVFCSIKEKSAPTSRTLFIALLLLLSASVKYMYVPLIFAFPLLYFYVGFKEKEKSPMNQGLILFITISFSLFLFIMVQQYNTGTVGYIKEETRGLFFDNLRAFHPFFLTSFVKPESIFIFFRGNLNLNNLYILFKCLQIIFLLAIVGAIIKYKKPFFYFPPLQYLPTLFFFITIILSGLLFSLSFFVGPEAVDNNQHWTYVEEPRYFGLIQVLTQLLFLILTSKQIFTGHKWFKVVKIIGLIFLSLEMFRGAFFTFNRINGIGKEQYGWQTEAQFQKCVDSTIASVRLNQKNVNTILVGSSDWMTLRVALKSHLPVLDSLSVLKYPALIKSSQQVNMIALIRDDHKMFFQEFVRLPETIQLNDCYGFTVYSILIKPSCK